MRSILHSFAIIAPYICSSTFALPFLHLQPFLQPRAKYSVVAVDGSSSDNNKPAGSSEQLRITTTFIQTQDQTETVTATATTPPPSVVVLVSTKVIVNEKPTDAAKSAKASVAIVNVDGNPSSSTTAQTSTKSSTTSATTSGSASSSVFTSSSISSQTYSRSTTSSSTMSRSSTEHPSPTPCPPPPIQPNVQWQVDQNQYHSSSEAITSQSFTTSSTKSYDNGFWHTSYPIWNATSTTSQPFPTASGLLSWTK